MAPRVRRARRTIGELATVGPLALPFLVLGAGTVLGAVALLWLPPAPRGVDAEFSLPTPGALRRTITPAIAVLGLSGFLAALGTAALNPVFAPFLRTTVDAGPGYVGLAWGLLGLGVAVFVPVGGTLADESGRVRTLVAGKGLWALATVGLAVATVAVVPLALVFVGGLASGLMGPAQGVLRYEIAPEGRESTLVGAFGALGAAGAVVGPVAGGWAADAVGVRTTAVIVGVVWVIDGLALHLGVSEPARQGIRSIAGHLYPRPYTGERSNGATCGPHIQDCGQSRIHAMSLDAREGDDGALAEAVGRYALGELSLGAAANLAGLTRWEMADLLEAADVPVRLGPESEEALAEEIEAARDLE